MQREETSNGEGAGEMHTRRITLSDGRYLIFYTFGQESAAPDGVESETAAQREAETQPEPDAQPSAEEERRV